MDDLRASFEAIAPPFQMDWQIHDMAERRSGLLMVSKFGHCLNDLLLPVAIGALPVDISAVVSNHPDFYALARWHGIPFHHLPVTATTKAGRPRPGCSNWSTS